MKRAKYCQEATIGASQSPRRFILFLRSELPCAVLLDLLFQVLRGCPVRFIATLNS